MSGITNRGRTTERNFMEAMLFGTTESIVASEKQGQAELVNSELLPTQMNGQRVLFEKFGFKFGEPVAGDPLFLSVTMPEGWKKEPTDHDMWSRIIDERGRERAMVFYKAAFYDRRADMRLVGRYKIVGPYDGDMVKKECTAKVIDTKHDLVLHEVTRGRGPKDRSADGEANDAASQWIEDNLPGAYDPAKWLDD